LASWPEDYKQKMNKLWTNIRIFLGDSFSLQDGIAAESIIVESVRCNVEFKGANLFALIFAIFIASIGLNVNSTAVIIGAMLISPIMGPVMGVGLGVGINDLQLVKKGLKNLLVATIIGIITSTIYFLITPLHEAQSELLARTSPSIWDVFIALFGGMAGMVAASRKEKNNVIPGVAIATALMPPLCTAGFGIATGNLLFVAGELYLYFINSVFIAIATFLMSRYLKMQKHHLEDVRQEKKVARYMVIIVVITIVPSILMAYRIVDKSIFENNARRFVEEQFAFKNTQVVSKKYQYGNNNRSIDLLLIGAELSKGRIDTLNRKLAGYKLPGVRLNIRQGLNARRQINLSEIRTSILEDVFTKMSQIDSVKTALVPKQSPIKDSIVLTEVKVLYPGITSFGVSQTLVYRADRHLTDTVKVALLKFRRPISKADQRKIQRWLSLRYNSPSLKLLVK
jgi:uncharacterized hydrophobic protein (TIGR00271 family)